MYGDPIGLLIKFRTSIPDNIHYGRGFLNESISINCDALANQANFCRIAVGPINHRLVKRPVARVTHPSRNELCVRRIGHIDDYSLLASGEPRLRGVSRKKNGSIKVLVVVIDRFGKSRNKRAK